MLLLRTLSRPKVLFSRAVVWSSHSATDQILPQPPAFQAWRWQRRRHRLLDGDSSPWSSCYWDSCPSSSGCWCTCSSYPFLSVKTSERLVTTSISSCSIDGRLAENRMFRILFQVHVTSTLRKSFVEVIEEYTRSATSFSFSHFLEWCNPIGLTFTVCLRMLHEVLKKFLSSFSAF